jgi:DNA mismatch endonuclease, patch repair protein
MDKLSVQQRAENMRRIRAGNTKPELAVRKILRDSGFPGYRLHRKDLPGKPDISFLRRRKAIFVHGCFWHGHECQEGRRRPKTNSHYWHEKIRRNQERDASHVSALMAQNWDVFTVWECELKNLPALAARLRAFLL